MAGYFEKTYDDNYFDDAPDRRWCQIKKWFVFDKQQDKIFIKDFCCGSWGCSDCVDKLRWKWSHIIGWGVDRVDRLRFLTLTGFNPNSRQAGRDFGNLIRDIRAAGFGFHYLSFNEIGKGGMRHKHMLLHGDFIPQAFISARCKANGIGGIVWITALKGKKAVVEYVMKYIGKDPRTWAGRKFSYSQQFFLGKTTAQIWLDFLTAHFGVPGERIILLVDYRSKEEGLMYFPDYIKEKVKHNTKLICDWACRYWLEYPNGAVERISGFKKVARPEIYQ